MLQLLRNVDSPLLLTAAAVRLVERVMIDERGVPGIVLMKHAGRALFTRVLARGARTVSVFCGSGNNAGDGYVVAGLAQLAGLNVRALQVGAAHKLPEDAATALAWARAAGVLVADWDIDSDSEQARFVAASDVIVDALLGTGFVAPLRAQYVAAIQAINRASAQRSASLQAPAGPMVIAADMPSGLLVDTGAAAEVVVRADETVTFIACKPGLLTGRGPEFCGQIHLAALAVPDALCWRIAGEAGGDGGDASAEAGARETDESQTPGASDVQQHAPIARVFWRAEQAVARRRRDAHKGDSGHVLVLGGAPGMGGAVMLTSEAALRCGAGLVSVGCAEAHAPALLARRPEVMVRGITLDAGVANARPSDDSLSEVLAKLLRRATVLAIGPGLGQDEFGQALLRSALSAQLPIVLDADALNLMAGGFAAWPNDAVITPHPAEAARILGVSTPEVQQDRMAAALALCKRTGAVVVLKGAGTVICDGRRLRICTDGNPGMAVAGMGDVLTGVIAAQRAQGVGAFEAAVHGVCAHARAGDLAIADGERGLLASDLLPWLRRLSNGRGRGEAEGEGEGEGDGEGEGNGA